MPHKVNKIHRKGRVHQHQNKPRFSPTLIVPDPNNTNAAEPAATTAPASAAGPGGIGQGAGANTNSNVNTASGQGGIIGVITSILGIGGGQSSTTAPASPATSNVAPPSSSSTTSTVLSLSSTSTSSSSISTITSTSTSTSFTPAVVASTTPQISSAARVPIASDTLSSSIFIPASSTTPVPTATSTSSGLGTGGIAGLAVAGIAGIAVLGIASIWLFKKYNSHKDEPTEEPTFTRHSWMRQSVAIPDEFPAGSDAGNAGIGAANHGAAAGAGAAGMGAGPSQRPRPPTMIERHQANVAAMRAFSPAPPVPYDNGNMAGYGAAMGYGASEYAAGPGYDSTPYAQGYGNPGQHFATEQPYYNPIASTPPIGPSASPAPSAGPIYFSRANSDGQADLSMPGHPYADQDQQYATMERSSPYQAQQYEAQPQYNNQGGPFADPVPSTPLPIRLARDIANDRGSPTPPLSPARIAHVVNVPDAQIHAGRETPVQFGFSEGVPAAVTAPAPAVTSTKAKRSSVQSKKSIAGRPETMYDEEDAYGGI